MDEVKVFKDEGEDETEQGGSESLQAELLEEKSSLITESEQVGDTALLDICKKHKLYFELFTDSLINMMKKDLC